MGGTVPRPYAVEIEVEEPACVDDQFEPNNVPFNASPLLWRKVGGSGLSAGRVQSPALRLIFERELEIEAFKPREYWSIEGDIGLDSAAFNSRLVEFQGDKVEHRSNATA